MTACAYCGYLSICQFDTSLEGNSYRNLHDKKDEEVWELLGSKAARIGGDGIGSAE
jgi:ATP-dependent helicase/nuclease subunit B